jgi:hypothetical protein
VGTPRLACKASSFVDNCVQTTSMPKQEVTELMGRRESLNVSRAGCCNDNPAHLIIGACHTQAKEAVEGTKDEWDIEVSKHSENIDGAPLCFGSLLNAVLVVCLRSRADSQEHSITIRCH